MGGEVGQWEEWSHESSVSWHLLDDPAHAGIARCVAHLQRTYAGEPALHELDFDPAGFEWVISDDWEQSVVAFLRIDRSRERRVLAAFNFTPVPRLAYRLGAPLGGHWREIANTDAVEYGGTGTGNFGGVDAAPFPSHGRPYSLTIDLPPLAAVFFANGDARPER